MPDVNQNTPRAPGFDPRLFLRDEELDYGISLILAGERLLMLQAGTLAKQLDLPPLATRMLLMIRFRSGQTVSALRDSVGATTPTVARLLAKLSERGFLSRTPHPGDGRARLLSLSDEGIRITDQAVSAMRTSLRSAYRRAGVDAVAGARAMLEALS